MPPMEDILWKPFDKEALIKQWLTCNTVRLVTAAVGFAAVSGANFLDPAKQITGDAERRRRQDAVTVADLHETSIA